MSTKQSNYYPNMEYRFKGEVASSVEDAVHIADKMKTPRWVVKAQVRAAAAEKQAELKSFLLKMN